LNVFLAIAVDNLANAQELTAAEEQAKEQAAKVTKQFVIDPLSNA
jgi:hypothetical protein